MWLLCQQLPAYLLANVTVKKGVKVVAWPR